MNTKQRNKIINSPDPLAFVLADALLQASENHMKTATMMLGGIWGFCLATALAMAFFTFWRVWL